VIIGFTWWIGAVVGVFVLWRRGNFVDGTWGLVAGAGAGIAASATIGSIAIAGDLGPHFIWHATLQNMADELLLLPLWIMLVLAWWVCVGLAVGICLTLLGPLARPLLHPFSIMLTACCRLAGLQRLADYFALP
jgi:hypothetical protein